MPIIKNITGKRVLSADGTLLGVVESVDGDRIKLSGSGGQFVSGSLIASVQDDEVQLSTGANEVTRSGSGSE
ncbi:DUF2171 domain-containing protein [Sphingomonas arenae]|uniref:DUF2171 domain-containing protein n=1 Tax=Sphingomonas arenae TaxID=2812555 RepID=UPI0019677A69|nr:DUF2171 domain-containing protein [Sphingomonas arenae]